MTQTVKYLDRYDRQLRIWGTHGQGRICKSKICLINATSLGIEVLKGLCLAGIGSFTILDSSKVTDEDIECNFIPTNTIGLNRGETVIKTLLEINKDVVGRADRIENYLPIRIENEKYWQEFNCVIVTGYLHIDQIAMISQGCWINDVPLIICKSIGFFGSIQSQFKEHFVIESHSDNQLPDFRLRDPFKDLKEYLDGNSDISDSMFHRANDYPYIIIVYHYLKKWQSMNNIAGDHLPCNHSEKESLRKLIIKGRQEMIERWTARMNLEKDQPAHQTVLFENHLDAANALNLCFYERDRLSDSLKTFVDYDISSASISNPKDLFKVIVRAVHEFMGRNGGHLPVSGTIPDMTSGSREYKEIQNIYSNKAKEDFYKVLNIIQELSSRISMSAPELHNEAELICKHIREVECITTRPIHEEYDFRSQIMKYEEEENDSVTMSLCLKALDIFFSNYGRLPGRLDDQVETDVSRMKDCVKQLVGKVSSRLTTLDQCLYEICRYGGLELHATSAFLGGCVTQEVLKFMTNQFVPLDNNMVYNAMSANVKSFSYSDIFATI